MNKIFITGATGLVGQATALSWIRQGVRVVASTRSVARAEAEVALPIQWVELPTDARGWADALRGCDAIVNLAGESVGGGKWTPELKKQIRDSRIESARSLVEGLKLLSESERPKVLVSASAIGVYGANPGDSLQLESSSTGDSQSDFLASVVRDWELEIARASEIGIREARLRFGVVLSPRGGALAKMVPLFREGAGGVLGSGQQWMSWVHLDDVVRAVGHAVQDSRVNGAWNIVAPEPARNREFTQTLAEVMQVPAILPAPEFALNLALGEQAVIVLGSLRVGSERDAELGFQYRFRALKLALENLLPNEREREIIFEMHQWVPRSRAEVFPFFSDAKNLGQLTPAFLNFKILSQSTPEVAEGTRIEYSIQIHKVPVLWRTRIESWDPPRKFVDLQLRGPYSLWHHTHEFEEVLGGTLLTDTVRYRVPLGRLGRWVTGAWIARDVKKIFGYRKKVIEELFGKPN